ncbi:MAG: nitronate monooxygenase [Thermomicrobiales bacterium]|nr:nitronate monooxygenase [Thermomicrobiales bacterium]
MLSTRFTELVGCEVPIQQAGMGSLSHPRLATAVAEAGGLGMISVYGVDPEMISDMFEHLPRNLPGAFGANIIPHFVEPDMMPATVAAAASQARIVEFFYSDPDPELVGLVHERGALACWQVGSRDEAIAAQTAGCDLIVAQGIEAGGHVRGRISLLALLTEVLESVDVPVLGAGGIGNGRALAAVLAAGADGARVGTRFVASPESGAHPAYVQGLITANAADTVYTDAFHIGWEDAPHRVLRSSLEAAEAFPEEAVGEGTNIYTGNPYPIVRFQSTGTHQGTTGAVEAMSLWAGESVSGVHRVQPAGDIVREMAEEADLLLKRWCA